MRNRGDTIIEVLLAVTIFSLVAVGSMVLMNRGVAMAQQSLETTLVRQQIDAQAEMLRFVHDQARADIDIYKDLWENDVNITTVVKEIAGTTECSTTKEPNAFTLYSDIVSKQIKVSSNYAPAEIYAKTDGDQAYGISIQLARADGGRAYDAYIQACWDTPSSSMPMTTGTIVRLYDPEVTP